MATIDFRFGLDERVRLRGTTIIAVVRGLWVEEEGLSYARVWWVDGNGPHEEWMRERHLAPVPADAAPAATGEVPPAAAMAATAPDGAGAARFRVENDRFRSPRIRDGLTGHDVVIGDDECMLDAVAKVLDALVPPPPASPADGGPPYLSPIHRIAAVICAAHFDRAITRSEIVRIKQPDGTLTHAVALSVLPFGALPLAPDSREAA